MELFNPTIQNHQRWMNRLIEMYRVNSELLLQLHELEPYELDDFLETFDISEWEEVVQWIQTPEHAAIYRGENSNAVQQRITEDVWKLVSDGDDLFDLANAYHALTQCQKRLQDAMAAYLNTNKMKEPPSWWIDHAAKDWVKYQTKTTYQKWMDGEIGNFGSFHTALLEAYKLAADDNRKILADAYPEWFKK